MKTLRIGFNARCLAEPETRGLTRYTVNLLRELSRRPDIDLVLFCMAPPHPGHLQGIKAKVVAFEGRETIWQDFLLPNALRREAVDLFHAPADRGLPFQKPCPFVVTVHDSYERTYWRDLFPTVKQRLWYWKNEAANFLRADAVLTVSDSVKRDLIELGVAPERKVSRAYLAPAPEFHSASTPKDDETLSRHGISRPYVLYVGGYDRRKNVDTLVRAFDRACLPNHDLVIVARKGGDYPALQTRWRTLRCHASLRCLEAPVEELPAFYRRADLFVNPSTWESFSFQMTEAMASGTPLLASNRKAIPEIAGGAIRLFDPDDVEGLARLMTEILADEKERAVMRQRGLDRAAAFSWRRTAGETLQVYRGVLGFQSAAVKENV